MFGGLLTGASLWVLRPLQLGPAGLAREIRTHRHTVLRSSPGLFRHLVDALADGERFDSVRLVLLGGDRVEWTDVDAFTRGCGGEAFLSVHLGQTECWTVHTQWFVDRSVRASSHHLPVGRAIADRALILADGDGAPVEEGVTGECVVSSRYLALGYWRDPELTARMFTSDPADPGARRYRTGDLAFRRPDGLLEYVGRADHRIKLAGRRIEPGEIESAIKACVGVRDAAVVVRKLASGAPRSLVAYVERRAGFAGMLPRHLKAMLGSRLPSHMMPASVMFLDELPRLPSFKVDRKRLEELDVALAAGAPDGRDDATVDQVARIFEEVLGVTGAVADDNISTLGGDSLQAIKIAVRLEACFGVRVTPDTFQMAESIGHLAGWISAASQPTRSPAAGEGGSARDVDARRPLPPEPAVSPTVSLPPGRTLQEWATTVDRLIGHGDLDAALLESRALHAAHPTLQYGEKLYEILARLPPADDALLPFRDDPAQAVQVVRRRGADTVLLLFCGRQHTLGLPLPVIHRWLGRLPATLVYLRDFERQFYFGGLRSFGADRAETIAGLRALIATLGGRRVVCLGVSAGSNAALHYALDLRADAAVALTGPLNFSAEFNTYLRTARMTARIRESHPLAIVDLRHAYATAERPPRALIAYGDDSWEDRLHAEDLAGPSSIALMAVEHFASHHVITELIKRDAFDALLTWLMTPGGSALPTSIPAMRPDQPEPVAVA
jgi:acyl carrier protein